MDSNLIKAHLKYMKYFKEKMRHRDNNILSKIFYYLKGLAAQE